MRLEAVAPPCCARLSAGPAPARRATSSVAALHDAPSDSTFLARRERSCCSTVSCCLCSTAYRAQTALSDMRCTVSARFTGHTDLDKQRTSHDIRTSHNIWTFVMERARLFGLDMDSLGLRDAMLFQLYSREIPGSVAFSMYVFKGGR